ncbi:MULTISPECIES: DarT ssDNA thymidine ADP-ribosyltransferase family protein [Enterococcus]|uniref:DarT domain-containing protein n=1 Tax=Candidatus Enterococcus ferrettii TaxID=2815324 RepID=A0ABV0ER51_9ENTE|nr:DarT ssDNA thymidine ADP-ribosyltransferase family protein [Enterococcus sp. 665A]MBO1339859.1 DUF4433 domain-containing protein [Enterococcus sp. 665A]
MNFTREQEFYDAINTLIWSNDSQDLSEKERAYAEYVYHFTDIRNAASILNTGKILSRNKAKELNLMLNDNASESVISGTGFYVKDYVRFYFRPKTPTQYRNEGIMSKTEIENSDFKAHCPVPVFFLFNSWEILGLKEVYFSRETLAKRYNVELYNSVAEFKQLPFDLILHNRSLYNNPKKSAIISHRQAELVVKDEFTIDKLKYIYVRSLPEKEFLLAMLDPEIRILYEDIILVDNKKNYFYGSRAYLIDSTIDSKSITLKFNPGNSDPEFEVRMEIFDSEKGGYFWGPKRIKLTDMPIIDLSKENLQHYEVNVYLDDIKIYQNRYDAVSTDLPF